MRKIREVLRLYHAAGMSVRAIARSVKASPSTVGEYIRRAEVHGLGWPLPGSLDDGELEHRLFPASAPSGTRRPLPQTLDVVMRQEHRAGEKMFVDYAGQTVPVVDRETGEERQAQVFVAVLGASSYTFAEATWTQTLPDWTASHVRAFEFFGGCPELLIPDDVPWNIIRVMCPVR